MSCGTPHEECREAIEKVYLYLDGEIADDDCALIRQHLEDCSPCLRAYGLEREFKALIARRCGCEETPAELRGRVLSRLREVRMEITHIEFRAE
jgi:mycothiol system anti-sigma-R factor